MGGKIGYLIGANTKETCYAAERAGWKMTKSMRWETPRGEHIKLAPDGHDFGDLSKRRVCYFVPGWTKRRDAVEIAYGLGVSGCETLTIDGEPVRLDESFVAQLAQSA
jgi:hypothetical protein